jgi:RNA polymerase sigma-70 factor (ECF subfamily)
MLAEAASEIAMVVENTSQRDGFLRLMDAYQPALRRLAGAYLEQAADQEDLFQEIAVALWKALPAFRGEASERTWLYRIAHNVAISSATRIRTMSRREDALVEPFEHPTAAPNAEQELLLKERQRLLLEGVRGLNVVDREVILLHLEGLSNAEIEAVSGLSEAAVATRLTRIREKLKRNIQDQVQSREARSG